MYPDVRLNAVPGPRFTQTPQSTLYFHRENMEVVGAHVLRRVGRVLSGRANRHRSRLLRAPVPRPKVEGNRRAGLPLSEASKDATAGWALPQGRATDLYRVDVGSSSFTANQSPAWRSGSAAGRAADRPLQPVVGWQVRAALCGTVCRSPPTLAYTTVFRRAASRNHRALIFGVRFCVLKSTYTSPKRLPKPAVHSRLSIALQ